MIRVDWATKLLVILGVALLAAAGAAALPDNPYQRWQLIENTLYANATWSYERIHFDARPIDVAIIGASRSQMGLSAPAIGEHLAAAGMPLAVANLSVVEDGRNLEWAIVDELFKVKRPKLLVVMIGGTVHRWGHPGFKYAAPAAAITAPPSVLLHNYTTDLAYLPYRQLMLFTASVAPGLFDLRDHFDNRHYAAKLDDYTVSHTLTDGVRIDMERTVPAEELDAQERAFKAVERPSSLPPAISRFTDIDDRIYTNAIVRLAAEHGAKVMFVFLPEYGDETTIDARDYYARLGPIADFGDFAREPDLFQSFSHLNHRGAMIASARLATAIMHNLAAGSAPAPKAVNRVPATPLRALQRLDRG